MTGPRAGRSRATPLLLVLGLVVVPVAELYVVVRVGRQIGVVPTLVVLVAVSLLGAALLRREGARAWRSFLDATRRGRVPAAEVADGALVLVAGALLLTPGFLTDVVGLLMLLPPVRAVLRRVLTGFAARRLLGGRAGGPGGSGGGAPPRSRGSRVVEGEVVDEP